MKKSKPAVKAQTPKPGAPMTNPTNPNPKPSPAPKMADLNWVDDELFDKCVDLYYKNCQGTPIQPSRHGSVMETINGSRFLILSNAHQEIAVFLVPETGPVVQFEWEDFEEIRGDE